MARPLRPCSPSCTSRSLAREQQSLYLLGALSLLLLLPRARGAHGAQEQLRLPLLVPRKAQIITPTTVMTNPEDNSTNPGIESDASFLNHLHCYGGGDWPGNLSMSDGVISQYSYPREGENESTSFKSEDSFSIPSHSQSNTNQILFEDEELQEVQEAMEEDDIFSSRNDLVADYDVDLASGIPLPIPLAYRFYRRALYRQRAAWSVPIILLGPNVDHWKATARELASAGFSAIACERVKEDGNDEVRNAAWSFPTMDGHKNKHNLYDIGTINSSAKAIADLLDALRWSLVVLVASDSECATAIQAALRLGPDRVVGLVLCGNLVTAKAFVNHVQDQNSNKRRIFSPYRDSFEVDCFLRQYVECPSMIVWDGDGELASHSQDRSSYHEKGAPTQTEAFHDYYANEFFQARKVIHGSGSAPHRKLPEHLAWVITRFVEENVTPWPEQQASTETTMKKNNTRASGMFANGPKFLRDVADFFSQEGMVVFGRFVASALLYGTAIKVGFYQYRSIGNGIFDFQTKVRLIVSAPAKFVALIGGLFSMKSSPSLSSDDNNRTQTEVMAHVYEDAITEKDRTPTGISDKVDPQDGDKKNENETDATSVEAESTRSGSSEERGCNDDTDTETTENDDEEPESSDSFIRPFFFLDYVIA